MVTIGTSAQHKCAYINVNYQSILMAGEYTNVNIKCTKKNLVMSKLRITFPKCARIDVHMSWLKDMLNYTHGKKFSTTRPMDTEQTSNLKGKNWKGKNEPPQYSYCHGNK